MERRGRQQKVTLRRLEVIWGGGSVRCSGRLECPGVLREAGCSVGCSVVLDVRWGGGSVGCSRGLEVMWGGGSMG